QPARGLARELLDVREKRDDVVTRGLLDRQDPLRIELALRARDDLVRGAGRHEARLLHRATDGDLDLEPELEPRLVLPQRGELRTAVASDHPGASYRTRHAATRARASV